MGKINKWLLVAIGAYLLFAIMPFPRVVEEWQGTANASIYIKMFQSSFMMTGATLPLLMLGWFVKPLARLMNWVCQRKVVIAIAFLVMGASVVFTFVRIAGLWWSWQSFGLQTATVLMAYLVLYKRIPNYEAVIAGIGVSGMAIGLWEIPYQYGFITHYEAQYVTTALLNDMIIREVVLELPLVFGGVAILFWLSNWGKVVHFNKWVAIGVGMAAALYVFWYATGFKCEVWYNLDTLAWENTGIAPMWRMVWKTSKVFFALGLVSVFLERKKLEKTSSHLPVAGAIGSVNNIPVSGMGVRPVHSEENPEAPAFRCQEYR